MKTNIFNSRILLGSFCVLYVIYRIFFGSVHNRIAGLNDETILCLLVILIVGIIQFIKINTPLKKEKNPTLWIVLFVVLTISFFIYNGNHEKDQIKKMYQIERMRNIKK